MANTEDDLAWLKSTFHPVPKAALPDDCIEYTIYAISSSLDPTNDSETRLRLKAFQEHVADLQKKWLKDYIWQRQGFSLALEKDDGEVRDQKSLGHAKDLTCFAGVSYLQGRTEYGDSIEDEWVIVWLLREISKQFDDAWIKVTDNDGEFLLIEASGSLPAWLEPDVAENRVWINDGKLKIIKPASGKQSAKRTDEKLSIKDAHQVILGERKRLMHSTLMEEEAFYRLRNYPAQIADNVHHALAVVPRTVAFLLHQNPAYIAPAIEAFYLRDPISLKKLNADKTDLDLPIQPHDLVTVSVRFPKVAYAQLKSQDFPAPKALQNMLSESVKTTDTSPAFAETGMKITCGFEMLLSDTQYQDKPAVREMKLLLEDIESGEEPLPTDGVIQTWPKKEDGEKWLDINFSDLEQELAGSKSKPAEDGKKREFGDKSAQENLQRIVKQFEAFMNDEKAGVDGAGTFDEDEDLDSDDSDEDDPFEDKSASFGDDDFTKLMQEMMGMPPEVMSELMKGKLAPDAAVSEAGRFAAERTKAQNVTENKGGEKEQEKQAVAEDEEDSDPEFAAHMAQLETELRSSGALNLSGRSKKKITDRALKGAEGDRDSDLSSDDDLGENDIDVNFAKNLLESFKAQGGTAGPMGNLMGLMGAGLPRDDRDEGSSSRAGPSSSK
ncbi:Protein SGT1 [Cyphellophora attinorum]|uniref:Protein SGT1 n=1 Tax=Cyphellophora attinorum TaxID=1664694 RepID=A0A0N1H3Z7_9EURO|nr:Protein SGT1 [Phialophora attinorum]KPI35275.1 Protein SGT1 [Phialophora attinorum]